MLGALAIERDAHAEGTQSSMADVHSANTVVASGDRESQSPPRPSGCFTARVGLRCMSCSHAALCDRWVSSSITASVAGSTGAEEEDRLCGDTGGDNGGQTSASSSSLLSAVPDSQTTSCARGVLATVGMACVCVTFSVDSTRHQRAEPW